MTQEKNTIQPLDFIIIYIGGAFIAGWLQQLLRQLFLRLFDAFHRPRQPVDVRPAAPGHPAHAGGHTLGIAAQDLGLVHVSTGIKVLDLGGDLGLVVGGVEQGDRALSLIHI